MNFSPIHIFEVHWLQPQINVKNFLNFFYCFHFAAKKLFESLKGTSDPKIGDPFDHKLVKNSIKRSREYNNRFCQNLIKSDPRRSKLSNFRKAMPKWKLIWDRVPLFFRRMQLTQKQARIHAWGSSASMASIRLLFLF